jgi:hypothetical protein
LVLRTRRFDSLMASVIGKIIFNQRRADDDHFTSMAQNSKNWKTGGDGNARVGPPVNPDRLPMAGDSIGR